MTTALSRPAPAHAGNSGQTGADPLRRPLLGAARHARGWLLLHLVARSAGAAIALLVPTALAAATDAVLAGRSAGGPAAHLGALIAMGVVAQSAAEAAAGASSATVTGWFRRALLHHLIASGPSVSRRFSPGDLTGRLAGSAQEASLTITAVPDAVVACGVSAGGLTVLFLLDPWSAATLVLAVVPAAMLMRSLTMRSTDLFLRYQRVQGAIAARLVGALAGARTVRACGTADAEVRRVLEPLPSLAEVGHGTWLVQRTVVARLLLVVPLVQTAVIAVAGQGVAVGRVSPGELLAVMACTALALRFLEQTDSVLGLARGRAGVRRVREVLDRNAGGPQPVPDVAAAAVSARGSHAVSLRAVTVRYGDTTALDAVDLDIPAGRLTAVVGHCGSGKSTLAAVIGGLVAPDRGHVLLDGVPLPRIPSQELRRRIAYAFERPAVMGETLHEAIAYGRPDASRADVAGAARLACADTFVTRLPLGYDTPAADAPLSGGEAQRLGVARALVQDASVLVLDDATSSLDTLTSVRVGRVITDHLRDRTRVWITRSASVAAEADSVLWLERGSVRAYARHVDLWHHPEYRALFPTHDGQGESVSGPVAAPGPGPVAVRTQRMEVLP